MNHYALGFLFNTNKKTVKLIKKNRPTWQAGYYNGIGGHIEKDELPAMAMQREFEEETGVRIENWEHCMTFVCAGGTVFVFRAIAENPQIFYSGQTQTDEVVANFGIERLPAKTLNHLRWMVPMLLDNISWPIVFEYDSLRGCKQEAKN